MIQLQFFLYCFTNGMILAYNLKYTLKQQCMWLSVAISKSVWNYSQILLSPLKSFAGNWHRLHSYHQAVSHDNSPSTSSYCTFAAGNGSSRSWIFQDLSFLRKAKLYVPRNRSQIHKDVYHILYGLKKLKCCFSLPFLPSASYSRP